MVVGLHTSTNTPTSFTLFDSNSHSILSMVPQQFLQGVHFAQPAFFILTQYSLNPQQMYINFLKQNNTIECSSLLSLIHRGILITKNSLDVQSKKKWNAPLNAGQSKKVRGSISSEHSCAHYLSLVQWCRIIIELSFGFKSWGQFTSLKLTCSSFLQCAFRNVKDIDPGLVLYVCILDKLTHSWKLRL